MEPTPEFLQNILNKIKSKSGKQEYAEIRSRTRTYKDLNFGSVRHLNDAIDKQVEEWELKGEDRSDYNDLDDIRSQATRVVAAKLHSADMTKLEFVLKNKTFKNSDEIPSFVDKFLEKQAKKRIEQYRNR